MYNDFQKTKILRNDRKINVEAFLTLIVRIASTLGSFETLKAIACLAALSTDLKLAVEPYKAAARCRAL